MKIFKWLAGFFEDQDGGPSSKRVVTFVCTAYLGLIVKGSIAGKSIDTDVLYIVAGLIAFGVGAITAEFIGKKYSEKQQK